MVWSVNNCPLKEINSTGRVINVLKVRRSTLPPFAVAWLAPPNPPVGPEVDPLLSVTAQNWPLLAAGLMAISLILHPCSRGTVSEIFVVVVLSIRSPLAFRCSLYRPYFSDVTNREFFHPGILPL